MTQLTLFDDVYQPRFQAYLDYKNATDHTEVKTYEFQIWIHEHVEAFMRIKWIDRLTGFHEEFTDYLRRSEQDGV